jgi:Chromosome segregation ATPases
MDHVKSDMISQYRNKTIKELLSMLENLRRDKKKFTSKDQALFERLGNLSEKYETNKERLNELEKNEEETYKLIQSFDANTQERISKVFKTFSNHFQNYFSKITQGGKAEAKLLKEKPKGRGSKFY